MNKLLVDLSPVLYGNLFSATNEAKKLGIQKNEDDNYPIDEYKEVFKFKVFEELASLRRKFQAEEVIIAVDAGNYWRKDVWVGYKHKRKAARDKSNVDWAAARPIMDEIIQALDELTAFNVVKVNKSEGDDIIFILSEYLAIKDKNVIIYSSDHDFIQCLEHENVKFWRTTRTTGMSNSTYYEIEAGELVHTILDHVIGGDSGDGINNVKGYSRFSSKFKSIYPDKTELEVWKKRFELDALFTKKFGESAYNHPRYGYKMFLNSKKTLEELLKENPVYKLNYALNRQIALPEGIPSSISNAIIEEYEKEPKQNMKELREYFRINGMFELTDRITFL